MEHLNPKNMVSNLWKNRELIMALAWRDLSQRYRGAFLGFLWSLITPLVMLSIYTFVFSYVFKARWLSSDTPTPAEDYALILFAGLTAFNVLSEVMNRSTTLISGIPNYVKKVVFPLEIYPVVSLVVAILMSLVNVVLLLIGNLILSGGISKTIFLLPLAYLPLLFLCLGLGWFLSSLGVYIRDLIQITPVLTTILFFLSPIVYPVTSTPVRFQAVLSINPLTMITEAFRQVILWGEPLSWTAWSIWTLMTCGFALLGYAWFMGTKKGFADVL